MDFLNFLKKKRIFLFTLEKLTEKATLPCPLKLQKSPKKIVSPMHYCAWQLLEATLMVGIELVVVCSITMKGRLHYMFPVYAKARGR